MSFITAIAPYIAAWCVLSVVVGLGVGRMFRLMGPAYEIDTPEVLEAATWDRDEYRSPANRLETA